MSELIDRQAVLETLDQVKWALWEIDIPSPTVPEYIEHHRDVQSVMKRIDELREKMERLPSAQQEIIRCKECMHRPTLDGDGTPDFPDYRCPCQCEDDYYSWMPKDDWFCGNAERRGNDQ